VASCSFRQQQSSKQRQVVTSGQESGQGSSQQKQGLILRQQCSKWGSFSWQQLSQSQQEELPHELPLPHPPLLSHEVQPQSLALQLAAVDGAADADGAAEVPGAVDGAGGAVVGAAGVLDAPGVA
jgi:hypothetical protein